MIQIRRSYSYTGKGYKLEEPKTDSGKRSIALPPSTVEELRNHKIKQVQNRPLAGELWQDFDLVCPSGVGTPCLQSNVRMAFYRLVSRAEVPRIRIHDLRHTHASMLLKQGVHPKVVQERLGHSDIQTTLNIYSHVLPGLQKEAAEQFDILLTNKNTNNSSL